MHTKYHQIKFQLILQLVLRDSLMILTTRSNSSCTLCKSIASLCRSLVLSGRKEWRERSSRTVLPSETLCHCRWYHSDLDERQKNTGQCNRTDTHTQNEYFEIQYAASTRTHTQLSCWVFHATGKWAAGCSPSHPLTSYVLESGRTVCHCANILWGPCALGWKPLCSDYSSQVSAEELLLVKLGIHIKYNQQFLMWNNIYYFVCAALTTTKCVVSVATMMAARQMTLPNQMALWQQVSMTSATAGKQKRMKMFCEFSAVFINTDTNMRHYKTCCWQFVKKGLLEYFFLDDLWQFK